MRSLLIAVSLAVVVLLSGFAYGYTTFDVVGDSISAGVNPDYGAFAEHHGWVDMLFGNFGSHNTLQGIWPGIVKYNSAVSGSKASEWATLGYAPMQSLLNRHPDLVVVLIGGNDFLGYILADGVVSDSEFAECRQNVETIIDRLQASSPRPDIILVGYYDLFDGKSQGLSGLLDRMQTLSQVTTQGNQMLQEIAAAKGCHFIGRVYDRFFHHGYGEELGDSAHLTPDYVKTPISTLDIHPNTAGHDVIYQEIYSKLLDLNNRQPATSAQHWILYR